MHLSPDFCFLPALHLLIQSVHFLPHPSFTNWIAIYIFPFLLLFGCLLILYMELPFFPVDAAFLTYPPFF